MIYIYDIYIYKYDIYIYIVYICACIICISGYVFVIWVYIYIHRCIYTYVWAIGIWHEPIPGFRAWRVGAPGQTKRSDYGLVGG